MHIPTDWTFKNSDVAEHFDQHVREQLPWYELVTGMVAHIARHYIPEGAVVYDIGASTGNIGRAIADVITARGVTFIPFDNSGDMVERYSGPGELQIGNAVEFPLQEFDLAVCFLVLMFIPVAQRADFINRLRSKIKPGGAVIIIDKTIPKGGYLSVVMSRLTLAGKVASGCEATDIIAKELSLGGIQRPLNESDLMPAREIFRFGDFAGWVIEG